MRITSLIFTLLIIANSIAAAEPYDAKAIKDAANFLQARLKNAGKSDETKKIKSAIESLQKIYEAKTGDTEPVVAMKPGEKPIEMEGDLFLDILDHPEKYLRKPIRVKVELFDTDYIPNISPGFSLSDCKAKGGWAKFRAFGPKEERFVAEFKIPPGIDLPNAHHRDNLVIVFVLVKPGFNFADNEVISVTRP
jgi:hypothetical protein